MAGESDTMCNRTKEVNNMLYQNNSVGYRGQHDLGCCREDVACRQSTNRDVER